MHPLFRVYKLKQSIEKMREYTAAQRLRNLTNYINRDKRNALKIKDPEKKQAFLDKVELWKEERDLIKQIKKLNE